MSKEEIIITTQNSIPGREISEILGIAIGVGNVAFGPFTATKAKGAVSKAMNDLGKQVNEMNADAVIGLQVVATSGSLVFFRPHTAIITGTAVRLN